MDSRADGVGFGGSAICDHWRRLLSGIPFSFERNAGQVAGNSADWLARGTGYQVLLGSQGALL